MRGKKKYDELFEITFPASQNGTLVSGDRGRDTVSGMSASRSLRARGLAFSEWSGGKSAGWTKGLFSPPPARVALFAAAA